MACLNDSNFEGIHPLQINQMVLSIALSLVQAMHSAHRQLGLQKKGTTSVCLRWSRVAYVHDFDWPSCK